MPVTQAQVADALGAVPDPAGGGSVVERGTVRRVEVDGGSLRVVLAAPPAVQEALARQVTSALGAVEGVDDVSVEWAPAGPPPAPRPSPGAAGPSPAGAAAGPSPGAGPQPRRLGHEEGRANPFTDPAVRTRVLGISSGKGGVGKSSVTVNLAVTLARMGHDVAVLDADVYGFSVPKMLGIAGEPVMSEGRIVPPQAYGVRCMSIGFFVEEHDPVMWRGPMLHKALEQFLVDVEWGEPDYLLIDMPPGTGDVALSMSQYLPRSEIYVVTTPQAAAQRVAQRTAYMAKKVRLSLRGVIENMSWFTADDGRRYQLFGEGGGAALAQSLDIPLLGQIPLVPAVGRGGDVGRPVAATAPGSEAAQAFEALATAVHAQGRARVFRPELKIH